jgi:hypothetical protein
MGAPMDSTDHDDEANAPAPSEPEFSRREKITARLFCVGIGAVAMAGGLITYNQASGAASTAGLVAAVIGSGLVIFGATAPDRACVKVAGTVLSLF